ncbi:hypothetical protein BD310DRAFT_78729 [Dichomitus squalens]|uniref:Uncharacterized protein n=1 Tax=Dichomitus squalens TaxID=114155 RepID=A0A4Q9PJV9_9APHY|nr:hypothetical protein BD310DRAFT_78729 [Dichomitus squalens]
MYLLSCSQCTVVLASRLSLIGADLFVLCVTWYKTRETVRISRTHMHRKTSITFAGCLLRDGTIYFLTLLTLSVLHVAFTLTSVAEHGFYDTTSIIVQLEEPLTSVLTARFLIDLQKVKKRLGDPSLSMSSISDLAAQPSLSRDINDFVTAFGGQIAFYEEDGEQVEESNLARLE